MILYDLACQQIWAMREGELRGLLGLLSRESLDPELARQIREDRASRPSALAAQAGTRLDNTRAVTLRGGVALIEVIGPIVRRADLFSEISGATDVGTLARDFATAQAAPNVDAVLLVFDSPGGEVGGIAEFAAQIAGASKPVWAYGETLLASAAYWLAAAAQRIVVDKTAIVGSIGILMAVPDPVKQNSKDITFVSSQSPHKLPDPHTETGRGQLQAIVDATAEEFVGDVARYRGVSAETVLADFGQGGVMVGKAAVAAGLVDEIGSFEATLAAFQAAILGERQHSRGMRGATKETPRMAKGFWAWMAGESGDTPATPPPALAPEIAAAAATLQPALSKPADDDRTAAALAENAALRTQLARVQAEQIARDAQAFATAQITAGHALPTEQAAIAALYARAAEVDSGAPRADGQPSMVALLTAAYDARPANRLASSLLPSVLPAGAAVLSNTGGADSMLDEAAASARAYAEKANGKK